MLITSNISYSYPDQTLIFPNINCSKGDHTLLLGDSGCGKTTLLQLLCGLRSIQKGDISIDGTSLKNLSYAELDQFRGDKIGLIFQTSHFIRALTVYENLAIAQSLAGQRVDSKKIIKLLDRLNIEGKIKRKCHELSQGEQQRVAIARALINNPAIILADEPTSALDDSNTNAVFELLIEQANEVEATLIVVTHDQRLKDKFINRIEL